MVRVGLTEETAGVAEPLLGPEVRAERVELRRMRSPILLVYAQVWTPPIVEVAVVAVVEQGRLPAARTRMGVRVGLADAAS